MLKFLLFLLLVFPKQSFIMACSYTNTTACNLQGKCTKSGTCLCDLFYYGDDCELGNRNNF